MFSIALGLHVIAGLTAVVSGALAAFARKRPGRHPRAGTVYCAALAVVAGTAAVMAALRWPDDLHLLLIAAVAGGLGGLGWLARRKGRIGWHGAAMAASYAGMLTGFYVDNGARLPVWERLPHLAYWLLPSAVALPLTLLALVRNGVLRPRRPAARRSGARPRRPGSAGSG
jgi:uncharacterized membrane protein